MLVAGRMKFPNLDSKFLGVAAAFAVVGLGLLFASKTPVTADDLSHLRLPPGFTITEFARVPEARSLTQSAQGGAIFVGSRGGVLHALVDKDADGRAELVTELAADLDIPNGVAVRDGQLFIALNDRIVSWRISKNPSENFGAVTEILDGLPDDGHHGWRYAKFGPDGKLYVSIGAPCNICDPEGLEGTIIRLNPDGTGSEVVARGIRNSVGFDWHSASGELWFTDNGADRMGDDLPPEEFNRMSQTGLHYGFPYEGGQGVKLTGYEDLASPEPTIRAEVVFQAHTAPLGVTFYTAETFPKDYKGDAFIAQHGSWNRSEKVGYRVMRVKFDNAGNPIGQEVFIDGWLTADGDVLGRPVDIMQTPDGSLLISDDHQDVVYRVSYREPG